MDTPTSRGDVWLSRIKSCVEIIAIFCAGAWALQRFIIDEAPSLEPRFKIESSIEWTDLSEDTCLLSYGLTFSNTGTTEIDVDGPTVDIWIAAPPEPNGSITYIEADDIKSKGEHFSVQARDLATSYPPQVSDHVGLAFLTKNAPGKIALVWASFPKLKGHGGSQAWYDYRWDWVCGKEPKVAQP